MGRSLFGWSTLYVNWNSSFSKSHPVLQTHFCLDFQSKTPSFVTCPVLKSSPNWTRHPVAPLSLLFRSVTSSFSFLIRRPILKSVTIPNLLSSEIIPQYAIRCFLYRISKRCSSSRYQQAFHSSLGSDCQISFWWNSNFSSCR